LRQITIDKKTLKPLTLSQSNAEAGKGIPCIHSVANKRLSNSLLCGVV